MVASSISQFMMNYYSMKHSQALKETWYQSELWGDSGQHRSSTKILPFIPVWWDIFWQTRRSSHARTSGCGSPRLRSFTLSIGGPQTDGPARTGDTNASGGWLRRILTPETQSAELRPMSNNSPDRGYATPTTDLFTYRWPQHLKSVAGGVEEGGRMGISWVGYCPCRRVRGKPSLRTSGDKCCALILSVTFFLLVVRMAEQPRLKFQPQKCDTE